MQTYVRIAMSIFRNPVVKVAVLEEVERLESVEDEVSHILIHVRFEDTSIKVVYCTTTIHHLHNVAKN